MDKSKKKFAKIYDKNVDKLYRFVYLKVSSQEKAQDITSQAFLKGWRTFQNGDIENPKAFLYQIARNLIVDSYREKDKAQFVSYEDIQVSDPTPGPDTDAVLDSDVEFIKKNLSNLKGEYQDIIIWHYIDDLSVKEISKILGKKQGTVRVTLHRALRSLRKKIQEA